MNIYLKDKDKGFSKPSNIGDAGYDVKACEDPLIVGEERTIKRKRLYSSIDYIEYDTGVSLSPDENQIFTLLYPRSSISKYNLALANSVGVIDSGYINTIKVRFKYIPQAEDMVIEGSKIYFKINKNKIYKKGNKLAQLIFTYHVHPQIQRTGELNQTMRGLAGFGSTGQ